VFLLKGCAAFRRPEGRALVIETTGYCACGQCCGWKRNWYGRPVYAYGPLKGKPKKVGVCADGTRARRGTLAADTRYFPFGTRFYIPGYGYATVHDRGGAIQGPRRLDLFFPSHREAMEWGRRRIRVILLDR
jgi:3D (Asp-Asp-Asp) domain-containing protein